MPQLEYNQLPIKINKCVTPSQLAVFSFYACLMTTSAAAVVAVGKPSTTHAGTRHRKAGAVAAATVGYDVNNDNGVGVDGRGSGAGGDCFVYLVLRNVNKGVLCSLAR